MLIDKRTKSYARFIVCRYGVDLDSGYRYRIEVDAVLSIRYRIEHGLVYRYIISVYRYIISVYRYIILVYRYNIVSIPIPCDDFKLHACLPISYRTRFRVYRYRKIAKLNSFIPFIDLVYHRTRLHISISYILKTRFRSSIPRIDTI